MKILAAQCLTACLLTLTACVSSEPISPKSSSGWIYLTTRSAPFCGRCDSSQVIVHYDGTVLIAQGHWISTPFGKIWTSKHRQSRISSSDLVDFKDYLNAFRPDGTLDQRLHKECSTYNTDQSGLSVEWNDNDGKDTLIADFGCTSSSSPNFHTTLKASVNRLHIDGLTLPEWQ